MAIAKQTTAIEAGASVIAAATISIATQHTAIAGQTAAFELGENEGFRGEKVGIRTSGSEARPRAD